MQATLICWFVPGEPADWLISPAIPPRQWHEIRRRAAFLVVAQELRHAFPNWTESAYAEWIETYSSEDFEVGCLASFVAEARPVSDV